MKLKRVLLYLTISLHLCFAAFLTAPFIDAASSGMVTSLFGGLGGQIPYQSAANTTAFLANGSAGQVLTSQGTTLAPIWAAGGGGVSGSGTAGIVPRWAAGTPSTSLEDSRIVATNLFIQMNSGAAGTFTVGDLSGGNNSDSFTLNDSANTITGNLSQSPLTLGGGVKFNSGASRVDLGDTAGVANGTKIGIVDLTQTIDIHGNNVTLSRTLAGSTGNQTINKAAGTVTFASGSLFDITVTNSFATTTSIIFLTPMHTDTQCTSFTVSSRSAGAFTITPLAPCASDTVVGFLVTN